MLLHCSSQYASGQFCKGNTPAAFCFGGPQQLEAAWGYAHVQHLHAGMLQLTVLSAGACVWMLSTGCSCECVCATEGVLLRNVT